jgi:hypothetical protein
MVGIILEPGHGPGNACTALIPATPFLILATIFLEAFCRVVSLFFRIPLEQKGGIVQTYIGRDRIVPAIFHSS